MATDTHTHGHMNLTDTHHGHWDKTHTHGHTQGDTTRTAVTSHTLRTNNIGHNNFWTQSITDTIKQGL